MTEQLPGSNVIKTDAEMLRDNLQEEFKDLIKRKDDLLAAVERVPATIPDTATLARAEDFINKLKAAAKSAEDAHELKKRPYLESGRVVDGVLKGGIQDVLKAAQIKVNAKITAYKRKVLDDERARLKKIEDDRLAELDRLAKEAAEAESALETEEDLDTAIAAEEAKKRAAQAAQAAQDDANAKAAELTRSRTDLGSVSSLRTSIVGKVVDLGKLDMNVLKFDLRKDDIEFAIRQYVKLNKDAIEADIKAGRGDQRVPGLTFEESFTNVTR